jgi:meiosis-specific transcription factor NDT80
MDSSVGETPCPPLFATEVHHSLQTSEGRLIKPEIFGKIDKGFFMADNDWTCYRRNYFSLNCSYTLQPTIPIGAMYLVQQHGGTGLQVHNFAMSIAAVVDGRDGKSIELVQHTPKRDKEPQDRPARITLSPRPPASHGLFGGLGGSRGSIYEAQGFNQNPNSPQVEATFERIQFKNATANNGKRRAAQQYYHLLVELFADVGAQHADRWVKIASRMSAPMVVRGRSPGHYQGERRGSNTSTGPGGSGGAGGGGGAYTPGSASRTPGDVTISGTSSMLSGPGYSSGYDGRSHHYRSNVAPLQIPIEPTLSAEEAKSIEEAPCYLYYPGAIDEGHEASYHLPSAPSVSSSEYTTSKIKSEFVGGSGYVLPSLSDVDGGGLGRHCGRWEGVPENKGYFPALVAEGGMNIT